MDTTTYIFAALAAAFAFGALFVRLFNLQASRLTEALFDALECALAARRERRAEMRSDDAADARAFEAPARARLSALTLVTGRDRAAA
ncbi:MAG TPA: hypothetical protein VER08_06690 [Pyrinomonadaceae bacterium]|nr:hypothetical protein [Pyrinomonadaceae bacterium]